jgi:hypothetical protein
MMMRECTFFETFVSISMQSVHFFSIQFNSIHFKFESICTARFLVHSDLVFSGKWHRPNRFG